MPKQRGKSEQELKRKKRFRRPSKLILIVVEGQETEYNYFSELKQDFKLPTTTIKVSNYQKVITHQHQYII